MATPNTTPTRIPTHTVLPTQTASLTPVPTATPQIFTATPTLSLSTPSRIFYTVKEGDTLAGIAAKFNLDVYDLAKANNLKDINLIFVDQVLLIAKPEANTTPSATLNDGKQIIVSISEQIAYAFEDGVLQREFIVSTGVTAYPTVIGQYEIYVKYQEAPMSGPGYNIPDVPWVMYFHKGYGFHGAPWNKNLGTPQSHGCVNLSVEDAKWLFDWAPVGTPVLIIP